MDEKEQGLVGRIKEKLVESKQKWAREGRLLTGETADPEAERLPPGQRLVQNWPVLDLGIKPKVALESWRLTVDGLVENPLSWGWAEFKAQPQVRRSATSIASPPGRATTTIGRASPRAIC